ncbi:MAG: RNA chaperone Hfq [Candidatus Sumerlaeaceae bacterium]|nr:RNA chaperone Hfq [Candidatus Sumerlaeaceae bacterium]
MSKLGVNLQDSFLNTLRKENQEVKVLLMNGSTLQGHVRGFDSFTFILHDSDGQQHLVYKHAVAHLVSRRSAGSRRDAQATAMPEQSDASEALEKPSPRSRRSQDSRPAEKPNKEGFNKIDLSGIRVEPAATPDK